MSKEDGTSEITLVLIERLLDRTERGALDWRPTFNREEFVVSFARSSVSIASGPDHTKNLKVYNDRGLVVDELVVDQRAQELWEWVDRLFSLARQQAMRGEAEKTVKELLEELA